jgi:hypothetical protein
MKNNDHKKENNEKSGLNKAYDKAAKGLQDLGEDVKRDTHEITEEFVKYGKNRLVSGGALALKFGLAGSVVPVIGTKAGAALGFTIGFFGGPIAAKKVEKWLLDKKQVSNDNEMKKLESKPGHKLKTPKNDL